MSRPSERIIALIVAAGEGRRMSGDTPKQYCQLQGKTVLRRSVEAFLKHPAVDDVCVVIHPDHETLYLQAVDGLKLLPPIIGGATRQISVRHGVEYLSAQALADFVLVHDAARCLIDADTISRVISALIEGSAQAVVPAIAVSDTLKIVHNSHVESTVDRNKLYMIQTPQGFKLKDLNELHLNESSKNITDDAGLAEAAGIEVKCVAGNNKNFKLTHPEDWSLAQMYSQQNLLPRTGLGYDVHRLIASNGTRKLWLCGVEILHDKVLDGHSDADVGLHALTDALLGALALGDIGTHFPPNDAQWQGADSAKFVRYCLEQVHAREALITHVDITLICEAPKVSPHRAAMQERVASLLNISINNVSIKATTTEKLGFTGRQEGIAAHAIATLLHPYETL
ncbi:MAG: bifunctional 2-C-methyl-D-erythritol 4-phosphate cytidylyltransferase/2-C-methyl-D-erythritol 2,4-cyclodiphosphate synthase [Alphaproteobacteria bacterium]|nr:bifunctional 2-C-methyl-D-erythritol 4-phosphate cytidylyltransferase/2-C-methyl-D-erythritol 2,4-cyclodiphosphate synthase [Alphaproteobacteria bacterium]